MYAGVYGLFETITSLIIRSYQTQMRWFIDRLCVCRSGASWPGTRKEAGFRRRWKSYQDFWSKATKASDVIEGGIQSLFDLSFPVVISLDFWALFCVGFEDLRGCALATLQIVLLVKAGNPSKPLLLSIKSRTRRSLV